MQSHRPTRPATASEWLRVVAAYLAVILALQGLAAAWALGSGPTHRHRELPGTAARLLSHAEQQHRDWHATGVHHQHAAADASVLPAADEDSLNTLAFALTAALALMAFGLVLPRPARAGAVWQAAPGWAWRTGLLQALFKPPRLR
jgi:hypothetical protein